MHEILPGRSPKSLFRDGVGWTPNVSQNLSLVQADFGIVKLSNNTNLPSADQPAKTKQVVAPTINTSKNLDVHIYDECDILTPNLAEMRLCLNYPYICERCVSNYTRFTYKLQAEDETDILLEMENVRLGKLVRDTWVSGDYIKFKRMLLRRYHDMHNVNWEIWSVDERMEFLQKLQLSIGHAQPKDDKEENIQLKPDSMHLQSGAEELAHGHVTHLSTEGSTTQQNTQFVDETPGTILEFGHVNDATMHEDVQPDVGLQDFLSRPVLINTMTWTQATTAGNKTPFRPWYSYFNNTVIKKKLDNYAFLTCNLRLKFVVNASPFYYGSLLYSYRPLPFNSDDNIQTDTGFGQFVGLSQRPHVWILPQLSQGGEMSLPFFYHKNWLNAGSATDLQNMGEITPTVYNILQSANGATGSGVTIQVYAWAENVKLMGPSIQLAVQSQDEYGTGVISKPASAIATALGMLGGVPVIGKYMTASSMVATAIGSVAHLFGFTNIPVIADVHAFKNQPFPHITSPEISTPVEKLTLDPKNELTIDSRTVGLAGDDELMISNLCGKESYLQSFTLSTADAVDSIQFSSLVTPNLFYAYLPATNPIIQPTPMCYVASLFQYWRGDIIYRFRFICTKYHKGRIRVSYDPSGDIINNIPDYATAFTQVIDIGAENDIELRVPYSQSTPWLDVASQFTTLNYQIDGTTMTHSGAQDNGMITVRVVTPLSAPVATSSIKVQIFVRAADNFELALPREAPLATIYTLQSQDEMEFTEPKQIIAGNAAGRMPKERYLVNMGENIVSLRTLLRRSTYHMTITPPSDTTDAFARWYSYQSRFPLYYGYDLSGIHSAKGTIVTATNFPFNFVKITPYNWIAPMFIGQRGSMMWHFNCDTTGTDSPISSIKVLRAVSSSMAAADYSGLTGSGALGTRNATAKWFQSVIPTGVSGMALTNQNTQTGVSVSFPNYSKYRFQFVSPSTTTLGTPNDDSVKEVMAMIATLKPTQATKAITSLNIDKYVSIGSDFNFFFFLNAPSFTMLASPVAN